MRITTWAEYALIVSTHLAGHEKPTPLPARDLAEREHLPADYVEQILLRLRRAGLVKSVRGARGGYLLARPASLISVRDIVQAAENHTFEVNCETRPLDVERCQNGSGCSIRPVWFALKERIDEFLDSVSLADLMADEAAVAVMVAHQQPHMARV